MSLGRSGAIQDWAGSKAIFLGSAASPNTWNGEGLWISLPADRTGLPLDQQARARIAQDLQAKFPDFAWTGCGRHGTPMCRLAEGLFQESELAQSLSACARHEPELMETVTPLLRGLVEEATTRRKLEAEIVVLEVLWDPAHQLPELSVRKITEYLNLRLRIRGGRYEYSEEEVGWILKGHGFDRRPQRKRQGVAFFWRSYPAAAPARTKIWARFTRAAGLCRLRRAGYDCGSGCPCRSVGFVGFKEISHAHL